MALKDAVKRRTHKERAQPAARRKLGLLEKKKDYLLRAKDFHKKEATIKILQQKAEERNPDEFYFAMERARTKGGVHIAPTAHANKYSQEQLRLMKTQDVGYLNLKAQAEKKKVERMEESLHLIGAPVERRHVVFVDDDEEAKGFDASKHFDTPAELLHRTYNRPRREQLMSEKAVSGGQNAAAMAAKAEGRRAASYKEMLQRKAREEALNTAIQRMEYEKAVMGKGRKRKLKAGEEVEGGGARAVFRWKAERKK